MSTETTELIALRYPNRQLAGRMLELWADGKAVLPLDPELSPYLIGSLLDHFRPAQVEDRMGANDLPDSVPVPAGTAVVVATSGTTGMPKGAVLSHRALRASARAANDRLSAGSCSWLACLPMSHVAGIGILVRSLEAGTTPVIHDRFDTDQIAAERHTGLISLVPTTLHRLIETGADLTHYHSVLVGGGPAPEGLIDRARSAGINIVCSYGMTETSGGCVYDGVPLAGVSLRIGAGDAIEIAGAVLMTGYRRSPGATAQTLIEGWLSTCDRGTIDQAGRLEVWGRADDVIITGGQKVSAREMEELLQRHELVAEAAVAGVDDTEWGQIVAALIVPVEGGPAPDPDDLRRFARSWGATFAVPKRVVVAGELPRTRSGKIRRNLVLTMLSEPGYREEVPGSGARASSTGMVKPVSADD
ncbi:MAG: class I adenylate-forming enzyme family protein [Actinomycetota bacterium]